MLEKRLGRLINAGCQESLSKSLLGLEKENLRVAPQGGIAQTAHPAELGAPLTHAFITTDYSEALTEFITPPLSRRRAALEFLQDTHKFVYQHLGDEFLWATSMPCVLAGPESIRIAGYGASHQGMMKTVYRRGLGYRYGRTMQVIAGVHFNFSLDPDFWEVYQTVECASGPPRGFVNASYFGLIRNLQRYGWLVPYLFGASPAVCKSFMGGQPTDLDEFDAGTYYEAYATSLRMGDIGYQNTKEKGTGIKASYDSLERYVESLAWAIRTPCAEYQKIGVKVDGEYRQLNANILQIENEYYSTVRAKQVPRMDEMPTLALQRRGVSYIELRSLDVNAFDPLGIDETQLCFLETLAIFCLLQESPFIGQRERRQIDNNLLAAAHRGRDPRLRLGCGERKRPLRDWALEICDIMLPVAQTLDAVEGNGAHQAALHAQRDKVEDSAITPSARMLAEMRDTGESFYDFARRKSVQHQRYFESLALTEERRLLLEQESRDSLLRQRQLEIDSRGSSFDEYLQRYFSQR
jgi:glutamate--cysteine ligase